MQNPFSRYYMHWTMILSMGMLCVAVCITADTKQRENTWEHQNHGTASNKALAQNLGISPRLRLAAGWGELPSLSPSALLQKYFSYNTYSMYNTMKKRKQNYNAVIKFIYLRLLFNYSKFYGKAPRLKIRPYQIHSLGTVVRHKSSYSFENKGSMVQVVRFKKILTQ